MQSTPSPSLVVCAGVTYRPIWRRSPVLADLSLEIQSGELFALAGPNGAGKSTLAQLIAGQLLPTTGQITVDEIDTRHNLPPLQGFVAYLAQTPNAPDLLTVQQLLFLSGALRGMPAGESSSAVHDLLDRCDLLAVAKRPLHSLPPGQQQLARFCAMLMGYPRLLVLDEPTTGLDPTQRRWVWDLLHELHRQTGITTIVISHDIEAIDRVVDRVAYLRAGQIVAVGSPASLKERYGTGPRLEVRLSAGAALDDRARERLRRLGQLSESDDGASFVLYPSPEALGPLARSVPMPAPSPMALKPAPAPRHAAKGKGAAVLATTERSNETWLLDRQMFPGTLGRTIEEIFVIIGPERIVECWFSPPALEDVFTKLGGGVS